MPLLAPFQALSDEIHLSAAVAGCLWLAHVDLLEFASHELLQFGKSSALKSLDHEIAAGLQPGNGKFERQLAQVERPCLIRRFDTRKVGGEIGNDKVDLA